MRPPSVRNGFEVAVSVRAKGDGLAVDQRMLRGKAPDSHSQGRQRRRNTFACAPLPVRRPRSPARRSSQGAGVRNPSPKRVAARVNRRPHP